MKFETSIFALNRFIPKSAWIDTALIFGCLVLANSFLSPLDAGWLALHPSPYFAVPMLLGCRYGFAAGATTGLLTGLAVSLGLNTFDEQTFAFILREHGYLLAALVLTGGICGETQRALQQKNIHMMRFNERLQSQLKELDVDMVLLREAKSEVERLLATQDSELSTLDSELRRLFDTDEEGLFPSLLLLLNRQIRISDAAIYLVEGGSSLRRKAFFGEAERLPEHIKAESVEIVSLALKNKTTATLPEIWKETVPRKTDYLMVVPFLNSQEEVMGLLVVSGMPFIALNPKAVSLVSLICRWASRIVERRIRAVSASRSVSGLEHQRIYDSGFFREHVKLALNSYRVHRLPSSIIIFTVAKDSGVSQKNLETAIMANVRSGDCPAVLDISETHLAVLLPLTGERGVSIFVDRILMNCRKIPELSEHIRSRWIKFDSKETVEEIWEDLTNHVGENSGLA